MKTKVLIIAISIGLFTFSNAKAQEVTTDKNRTEQVVKNTYSCPMHPEITQNKPGSCPKCGMDLQKVKKGKTAKSSSCCPSGSKSKNTKEKASCGMKKGEMKESNKGKENCDKKKTRN